MSLIRQITLLVASMLVVALLAGAGVMVVSARDALETQLRLQNLDNANALAFVLSQQHGDADAMRLAATAQFDTGHYRSIRLRDAEDRIVFEREGRAAPRQAPDWFVALLPIETAPGIAQLADGWRLLGSVALVSQTTWAHDELWRGGVRAAGALALVGVVAGAFASIGVRRIRRPLDRIVDQATALQQGDYRLLPEPAGPELRRLTRTMNALVERLRTVFADQAREVEAMRRHATCDPATGLANRSHFLARLGASQQPDAGPVVGGLVLLRLARLDALNAALGRERVDALIRRIADVLLAYEENAAGSFSSRLNGSDFALALPVRGVARESAEAVVGLLRVALADAGAVVSVAAGAVEIEGTRPLPEWLGAADRALATAESDAPFSTRLAEEAPGDPAVHGERVWRAQMRAALDARAGTLAAFRVVDRKGRTIHLETPLRLRLGGADAPFVVAARWLPIALRSRLTDEIDEFAIALALAAIADDGRPRAVNVAPASLRQADFGARVAARLAAAPVEAARLSLAIDERAAVDAFESLVAFGRQVRSLGARFGLAHAGERLAKLDRLLDAGLDYVRLEAALGTGIASDPARAEFLAGLVRLLHAMSLQVHVEGVADPDDAAALFRAGVDGLTGPWSETDAAVTGT